MLLSYSFNKILSLIWCCEGYQTDSTNLVNCRKNEFLLWLQILKLHSAPVNKYSIIITEKNNTIWQYFKIYKAPCKAIRSFVSLEMIQNCHSLLTHLEARKLFCFLIYKYKYKYTLWQPSKFIYNSLEKKNNLVINYLIQKKELFWMK